MATSTSINLTISYPKIKTEACRLLAVLGKRTVAPNGDSQFTRVQLGSAEEPIILDFTKKALHDVVARIAPLVTDYTEADDTASFTITNQRWDAATTSGLSNSINYAINDYCSSTAIADYLSLYFPQQSQFYSTRATSILETIVSLCFFKQAPEVPKTTVDGEEVELSYGAITGETIKI